VKQINSISMNKFLLSLICLFFIESVQSQTIDLLAGTGILAYSGDGGSAKAAQLCTPVGVAVDKFGNTYISDYGCWMIRKVNPLGIITTIAGAYMVASPEGDGGPATASRLYRPAGIAVDTAANIYVCDHGHNKIRKISNSGIITTVAGTGSAGYNSDGILAINANLNNPLDVAVDRSGNIYIADQANCRIRKVNTNGIISTVAGNGVCGFSGDGGLATSASISNAYGVEIDCKGNILIADYSNYRIRKVDSAGIITTIAGNGVLGYSGDGGQATLAQLSQPSSVCADSKGNIFVSDMNNQRIRKINALGIITTIAGNGTATNTGDGGLAVNATVNNPTGIQADSSGVIYFGSNASKVRAICPLACPFNISIGETINEIESQTLYPNPTNGQLFYNTNQVNTIEIYNITGQKIHGDVSNNGLIDISNLSPGMYFVRMQKDDYSFIEKIIKY